MKSERFEALDAWRGIAALVVALVHLPTESFLHHNALVGHGTRFVDFFFVLSGFVIAHAYNDRLRQGVAEVRSFLVRRVGRLWPLHVTLLAAFVGLQLAVWAAGHFGLAGSHTAFARSPIDTIPANLLMVHAWGMYEGAHWNGVSWSISTELFAYGVFAAMSAIAPRRLATPIAIAILLGAAAVVAFVAPLGMKSMVDFGIFRCLYGFMTGVVTRALWGRHRIAGGTALEVVAAAAVLAGVCLIPTDEWGLAVTPLFAVGVLVFAAQDGAVSRALSGRIPQALGAWSYSIYMVHPILTTVFFTVNKSRMIHVNDSITVEGPMWLTTAMTLAYLATVVGVASLTYRFIEMPGQRFFNRFARAHRRPPPLAAS